MRLPLTFALLTTFTISAHAAAPDLKPTDPPSLAILINTTKLPLAPVETRTGDLKAKAPANYEKFFDNWDSWPGNPTKGAPPNAISLSPHKDDNAILILGGLFRAFDPAALTIKSADGKILKTDQDYKFNPRWAQISNLNSGLGKPGEAEISITYTYALQRLDLLETSPDGTPKIKTGKSVQLCPELPAPDENCTPLAGIYIAPWKEGEAYAVTAADIFPIEKVTPVAPINPAAIATFKKKLENNENVKIAFCGDSITLGAESGNWWENMWTAKNPSYASRVLVGLQTKYPKATITPIAAFQGATTTHAAMGLLEKALTTEKPDLVIVAFGMNDAAGPVGGKPTNPPEGYKADILGLIQKIKENNAEVLLVTPFEGNPFLKNQMAQRIPDYRKVLLELSKEQNVACADVYTEWMNQAKAGIPPFSQVHNWINHPGPNGHALYARVILRFFE